MAIFSGEIWCNLHDEFLMSFCTSFALVRQRIIAIFELGYDATF